MSDLPGYVLLPREGVEGGRDHLRAGGGRRADCGDDTSIGPAGSLIFLPRGRPHTFRSVDGPARILFIVAPGISTEFFQRRDEAVRRNASWDESLALIRDYGF